MPEIMKFTVSDSIAGYVVSYDEDENSFVLRTTDGRDFTLLQTTPGIGDYLGLTILHEIGDIAREILYG